MTDDPDDALDAFLDEWPPDEHGDWAEWGDGYCAGFSVRIGGIGNRGFVVWHGLEGFHNGWEEWDGEKRTANAGAQAYAEDLAYFHGAVDDDAGDYGLGNDGGGERLPPRSGRLGTINCYHSVDGDSSYSAFDVYQLPQGTIAVTFRGERNVIGTFDDLPSARATFDPPPLVWANFYPTEAHRAILSEFETWHS